MKQKTIKLYSEDLLDLETEIHYAFHKSLKTITTIHSHNFYELFLIVKGEVMHLINDKVQKLTEGTLVFIRPTDIHCYQRSDKKECQIINLAFRQSTIKELFAFLSNGFPSDFLLNSKMPAQINLSTSEREMLVVKLEYLNTMSREDKTKIKTTMRVLLFEIFTKYFSSKFDNEKKQTPEWLESLLSEMQKKENFVGGIKRFYQLTNKTPEHLSRVLKKYFSKSPTDYINELKLNYAANLLSNSDENISFISIEAGFENLSHFYHLFKKKFNTSPADFRKQNQKSIIPA
jgi:AraC family cel operon transcriptional repressor